jgi:hypothetical protein
LIVNGKSQEELFADILANFSMMHVDIAFNVAPHPYYQSLIDAIAACGLGFKSHNFYDFGGGYYNR